MIRTGASGGGEMAPPESLEWRSMEPQEFKFRGGRILFDVILTWLAAGLGAMALRPYVPFPAYPPVILGLLCLALLLLTYSLWLLRVWVDRDGISLSRSGA